MTTRIGRLPLDIYSRFFIFWLQLDNVRCMTFAMPCDMIYFAFAVMFCCRLLYGSNLPGSSAYSLPYATDIGALWDFQASIDCLPCGLKCSYLFIWVSFLLLGS